MPEDHSLKIKKEQNLKKQIIQDIYQSKVDKACFQHNMPYGDFKVLPRRIVADKVFEKAFNIAKNPNGYQR